MGDLQGMQPILWVLHCKYHCISSIILVTLVLVETVVLDGTKNELPAMLFSPIVEADTALL